MKSALFSNLLRPALAITVGSLFGLAPVARLAAGTIVFQRGYVDEQYGFGGSLYMVDSASQVETPFFGAGNHPNYAPDGTQIIFVDQDGHVSKTAATDYQPQNLVFAGGGSPLGGLKPKWSPDATLIAFETQSTNANKIVITNATCTSGNEYNTDLCNYTKLDETLASVDSDPDWYPIFTSNSGIRSGRVIFVRKADANSTQNNIYATDLSFDANGVAHQAATVNLTQGLSNYEAPSYSHDGTKIVFVQNEALWLMNADGTNQHPIVSSADSGLVYGFDPSFSPDDSKITWGSGFIYTADLVINSNGSVSANNITGLTNSSSDRAPSWTGSSATGGGGGGDTVNNSFNVPGTANIWLAGVAAGTTASNGQDTLQNAAPHQVQGLTLHTNDLLTFSASGSVSNDPAFPNGTGPDGGPYLGIRFYLHALENHIAALTAPINSLVGVFLDDSVPTGTAPAALNFNGGVTGGTSYASLSPKLKQPFFIGDGLDDNGRLQSIVVPGGATRLFLGSMDPSQNSNNLGSFAVIVNPPAPPDHGGLSATTFEVNESSTPAASVTADSVLRFLAVQTGHAAGTHVRVQSSQTPATESSWSDLPDLAHGSMSYESQVNGYVLNSTSYPTVNGISFRAVTSASGYPDSVSNPVGPFNLASTKTHLAAPLLFITTNGEVNAIRFGAHQTALPSGINVRVQTSQTPSIETSWADAPLAGSSGQLVQDAANPTEFYQGTDDYPAGSGVYFRAIARATGDVDGLSFAYGPFTFIKDPAAAVTITIDGSRYPDGNSIDEGQYQPQGVVHISATAVSGRQIKRLALLIDGVTVSTFLSQSGALDYNTNVLGSHLVEAIATDDLSVTGAAPPVHIRVIPNAPGRTFGMVKSGDWSTAANWIDTQGNAGVPGPNDFAIVSNFSPTLSKDVTVGAVSLNGGTIGYTGTTARTLTVTSFCTVAAGAIKSNLTIPSGATCELLNDANIGLSGHLSCGGTFRLHGKGGITGINLGNGNSTTRSVQPDGLFDFVKGIVDGVGKFFVDLASGGRKGSKSAPPPANPAPEVRTVDVAKLAIPIQSVPAPLISQDGGGLISQDGGGLTSPSLAALVASGAGNLVASGAGNLISQDGGGVISNDGGSLVASGGGNLVATGGGNLVASGGGNLVASGAGNAPTQRTRSTTQSNGATATSGFFLTGGETNLDRLTITGPVELDSGILSGSGFIFGNVTNNGAYISPGHSAGAISIVGNFTQVGDGTLIVEDGGAYPNEYDRLAVSGSASLGGTLDIRTINGYTPDPADTFSPLAYGSRSGTFTTISSNASVAFGATGLLATANPSAPQPSAGELLNISTRMNVGTGENVMIAGFIVTGSNSKQVLIRGLGPELSGMGVPGVLADPTLELHEPNGTVVSNDNWKDTQKTAIIATTIPPRHDSESAIIATLAPGAYTAILAGAGGSTGVGLIEVYDLDQSVVSSSVANISTRGSVQTDANVLIGGFIVGGSEPGKILVRAIGPSLTALGLNGALTDPVLELHDANGNVTTNDNWRETQEAEINGTTLAPKQDKESAILATFVPGNYTAIVRGAGGTTGIALVEAYALP